VPRLPLLGAPARTARATGRRPPRKRTGVHVQTELDPFVVHVRLVILFVSDVHFGRGPREQERDKERALVQCLEHYADQVEHLYLVGDVYDGYIEYRHLVPKGFVRFQALLARWTDRGVPVTYLVGNHDSWHRNHFAEELGVTLVPDALEVEHHGRQLHLAHGDAQASTHPLYAWVRPLLRHPLAIRLYRSLLPADLALGLAREVSRALHESAPDPDVVEALRSHAQIRVQNEATDLVVRGHSHEAALHRWPEGTYLNVGNWYESRTFARLDGTTVSLVRWNGTRGHAIESADV